MVRQDKKAVLLIGHGSRAAGANDSIYQVAELVKKQTGYQIVELGFMGLNPPSISDGVKTCIEQGATKIIVIPYFLHLGVHMQKDLPNTIEELRSVHPETEILLGNHIGFHPKLVEVVVERINELDGVRQG